MTIRSFINFGQTLYRVGGVDIHILEDQSLAISYTILEQKKDFVVLVKYATGLNSLLQLKNELLNTLPAASRVHINLCGKDILTKFCELKTEEFSDGKRNMKTLFPMVKPEEFAIQEYQNGEFGFYSIIRKDVFDIVNDIGDAYTVVSCSLDNFILSSIALLLNINDLVLNDCIVTFKDNKIVSVKGSANGEIQQPVQIGGDTLTVDALPSYASAWNVLFKNQDLVLSGLHWVDQLANNYTAQKALYRYAKGALLTVISVLTINSVFFFLLKMQTEELSVQSALFADKKNVHEQQSKRLSELVTVYQNLGWKSNTIPIYYADQIANTVIPEIQLTDLEVGVLDLEIQRKEKRLFYQPSLIKVAGNTDSPVAVQRWIKEIENLSWIDEVSDQKYYHDPKQKKGIFEFYLHIK